MDFRRTGIGFLILILFIGAVPTLAQEPPDAILTWEHSPDTHPIRHMGDWMLNAGWRTSADIFGPFSEGEFDVGDLAEFMVSGYESATKIFELRYRSDTAYFWFENGTPVDEADLEAAAAHFDAVAVPFLRGVFGDDTGPGVDGDARMHIVHENFIDFGAVGVFSPEDQCAQSICAESNQRDIIYYSLDWGPVNSKEHLTTITHEYQHLIRYAQDGNERRWLNEGLSQLAEHLTGSAPELAAGENMNLYLTNPNIQFDGWADFEGDSGKFYGSGYLFTVYLFEQFGLDFIRALSGSPYDGLAAVYRSLGQLPEPQSLNAVFEDWLIANYLDNPFAAQGQYYYAGLDVPRQIGTTSVTFPPSNEMTYTRQINQYGAEYFELQPGTYDILFEGASEVSLTGNGPRDGDTAWWGYNAEASATWLTYQFDLTEFSTATLEYAIWYDVENDYDWVDVMVSVDGGNYWKPLTAGHMRAASEFIPVAHYTGRSAGWLDEQIDLTPYTGKSILLRFEYVTDGTITYSGVLLDNIAIPEIGFMDDAESAAWQVDGFLRVPEKVSQEWAVAFISKDTPPIIETLTLSPQNIAQHSITVPEGGGVLVIGAMAPLTAQASEYKLVIQATP